MSIHQGVILKKKIKEKGFKQEDFAKKLGVSRNYLLTLLDKVSIKEKYIQKACQILKVDESVFTESTINTNNNALNENAHEKEQSIINNKKPDQMKTENELRKKVQELEEKLDRAERRIDALLFKEDSKAKSKSA